MALEISRESFEKMSHEERHLVISEGAVIIDPGQREAEARREQIQRELAAERKRRTVKRSFFDSKMTPAERWAHIRSGGLVED